MQIKELTNRWLTRTAKSKGILACGIRYPDQTTFNQSQSPNFTPEGLDSSLEHVASTFNFLKQQNSDVDHMCWVFENHLLYCASRKDEVCLGIFTSKDKEEHDSGAINRLIAEFKTLKSSTR
jgi:hypothetical protein